MNTSSRYTPSTTYSGCLVHSMVQALNNKNALVFCVDPKHPHTRTQHTHTKTTPPWGHKKRRPPTKGTPTHKKNCGSHLLSHTHQDAVPSTPQGLAHQVRKGYWAFPPSYHHRKTTKQQPTPQKRGPACCFKTIQRTQTNNYSVNKSSAY